MKSKYDSANWFLFSYRTSRIKATTLKSYGCGILWSVYVPVRRSSEKRWGFLFTWLNARAVHLEIVPSLDTSYYVMGIEQSIVRPGTPSTIWSDNGTKFVGAEKELLACIKSGNGMAPTIFAHRDVTWKFNPPCLPHHRSSVEQFFNSRPIAPVSTDSC